MTKKAQQMYALNLEQSAKLIEAIGHMRTVLMQGEHGTGPSSTIGELSARKTNTQASTLD